ncbi:MAG TPA: hypothetical protein VMZ53_32955 [Kofleriaceae bacterium]|nr:hypothetical protein [Kofleriaceae bacterium]
MSSAGCASTEVASPPDAAPIAMSPVGRYDIVTSYAFASPPPDAERVLAELQAATDGPDDPARYLVDKLIARLPDADMQELAARFAPYLAAYLQTRLDSFAPQLTPAIRSMTTRLADISRRMETVETLTIASDGTARRDVFALRFGPAVIDFTQIDPVLASATLSGDQLTIGSHSIRMPYGTMLRAGFDHAVLPVVAPGSQDLASALGKLVDCNRFGALVAEWMGIGTPEFYARACTASLTLVAANIYAKVSALDDEAFGIEVMGIAHGEDVNRDGAMDRIDEGRWNGAFGTAIFEGGRR